MNKIYFATLIFSIFLFAGRVNYWNLGISINDESRIVVQKKVDLNNFYAAPIAYKKKLNSNNPTYTFKTNYIMKPTFIDSKKENQHYETNNQNIKELILNGEYFEAAKHILQLENNNQINSQFSNLDDFYYWTGFVYYNLGNYNEAYSHIKQISNLKNPEEIFLAALILQANNQRDEANIFLEQIIDQFPGNDYADYAKNLLIENND